MCVFTAIILLFSAGCGRSEKNERHEDHGTLEIPLDASVLFDVSGQTLYSFCNSASGVTSKEFNIVTGEEIGETVFPDFPAQTMYCCDIDGQTAYIAVKDFTSVGPALYKADLKTGETAFLYDLDPFSRITKIRKDKDTLYVLGTTLENSNLFGSYDFYLKNGEYVVYEYKGEKFAELDLSSGTLTDSGIKFPVAFDERDGKVCVYAFEEENGYYFLDCATGEKYYDSYLELIRDMTFINDNGDFYFPNFSGDDLNVLRFYGIGEGRGVIRRKTDHDPMSSFISAAADGYLYTITYGDTGLILSGFYVDDVDTTASPIRIVNSEWIEPPLKTGYAIRQTQLTGEEFALKVLSLDPGYDIALFKSDSNYAEGMRKSDSFYPLNDVPGVSEYLDRCFPSIKEAATDADGNIWAFPVRVDVPLNIYDAEHCAAENIVLDTDLNGFFQIVDKLGDSQYYSYNQFQLRKSCFSRYLMDNDTFDTPLFREMAQTLKEHWDPDAVTKNIEMTFDMKSDEPSKTTSDNFLFMEELLMDYQKRQIGRSDGRLRAAAMPKIGNASPNMIATFICVNPNSENLEETLRYVSELASVLGEEKDFFMFADPSAYTDDPYVLSMLNIYQSGKISFEIPGEIYYDDFDRYLEGGVTLDEFITEADRKLSTYLNE